MFQSTSIEEWKFLIWVQQLLAHIDTDILPVIEKLLLKIVEKYPNVIQFSFFSSNLVQHDYKNSAAERLAKKWYFFPTSKIIVQSCAETIIWFFIFLLRLKQTLNSNSKMSDFVNAIACIRVPDDYFHYHLRKLPKLLKQNDFSRIQTIKKEMDDVRNKGKLFTENIWWERLKRLLCKSSYRSIVVTSLHWFSIHLIIFTFIFSFNILVISANIENKSCTTESLLSEIYGYLNEYKDTKKNINFEDFDYKFLRNYNSWFNNFCELVNTNIEIPGQYDGFKIPDPDRHVKIFEFCDRNVSLFFVSRKFRDFSYKLPVKNFLLRYKYNYQYKRRLKFN